MRPFDLPGTEDMKNLPPGTSVSGLGSSFIWCLTSAVSTRQRRCFTILLNLALLDAGDRSMERNIADHIESDELIFSAEISDDLLERAAGCAGGQAITWAYCTHAWYNCGWPQ